MPLHPPSVIAPGNVQQLAGWVQQQTGGDLFSIRVTDPIQATGMTAWRGPTRSGGRQCQAELVENVENLEKYDVVFLGYPQLVVWGSHGSALLLANNDLSGKQVYLFCSHGTGRPCQQCGHHHGGAA